MTFPSRSLKSFPLEKTYRLLRKRGLKRHGNLDRDPKPLPFPSLSPSTAAAKASLRSSQFFRFETIHQSKRPGSRAQVGRLITLHGDITTPSFVPVATNAVLKAVDWHAADDDNVRCGLAFCNTYHLMLHPGICISSHTIIDRKRSLQWPPFLSFSRESKRFLIFTHDPKVQIRYRILGDCIGSQEDGPTGLLSQIAGAFKYSGVHNLRLPVSPNLSSHVFTYTHFRTSNPHKFDGAAKRDKYLSGPVQHTESIRGRIEERSSLPASKEETIQ